MVASVLLIVGLLGVLSMYTGAVQSSTTSNTRVAATNLARELVETAREVDYDDLDHISAQAQARGLGSGTPWLIERRDVTYTVTASTCAFDSPTDGYAPAAPADACNATATGSDANGDDFRRVTFDLRWTDDARSRLLSQTTLVVNPAGGLGPRIKTITPLSTTIDTNVGAVDVVWKTTPAQSLRWEVDDGVGNGSVSGTTSFTTTWDIGTSGASGEVLDGAYTMSARAFDDRDVPGESRRADIVLNRRAPYAPSDFAGGHNTRAGAWVDLDWALNRERDILGYRVVWAGADDVLWTADDEQICPAANAGSMLPPTADSCTQFGAPAGAQTYSILAIDRDTTNELRDGSSRTLTIGPASTRPASPATLEVTTVEELPRLMWTAPPAGGAAFYRIYRDGTEVGYADRYDRREGTLTTYTDSNPGGGTHRYWVTTVGSDHNESDPVGPVTWTP